MNDGGSIIITSSIMGVTADPGVCAYVTSKHALIGLMRTVAKEAAPRKIRVNVVAPGPLGRHGRAEEIARLVLFLASDQGSFSTGSVFMADGGMNI
jgi:NAD(P)-dependent dehydrogenase (short-subunit alcohol dehydrogenase family)